MRKKKKMVTENGGFFAVINVKSNQKCITFPTPVSNLDFLYEKDFFNL